MAKRKRKSAKTLARERAWTWFSRYIRMRDADTDGVVKCATCDLRRHWKKMQAGHFIPQAQGNATRFIEENVHAQCFRCNNNLGGNAPEYYPYMVSRYGERFVTELRSKTHDKITMTEGSYVEIEDKYKALVKENRLWNIDGRE